MPTSSARSRVRTGAKIAIRKGASRAVKEYLATLEDTAWGAATDVIPKFVSPSDPAAQWNPPPSALAAGPTGHGKPLSGLSSACPIFTPGLEFVIYAGANNLILQMTNVDCRCRGAEGAPGIGEVDMEIFKLGGPVMPECPFDAGPGGPSVQGFRSTERGRSGDAGGNGRHAHCAVDGAVAIGPAAGHIPERPIEGDAATATHGPEPSEFVFDIAGGHVAGGVH